MYTFFATNFSRGLRLPNPHQGSAPAPCLGLRPRIPTAAPSAAQTPPHSRPLTHTLTEKLQVVLTGEFSVLEGKTQ